MSEEEEKTPKDYEVGQTVCVYGFGHWYEGVVMKVCRKRVHAEYTTGSGATHVKKCTIDEISERPISEMQQDSARSRAGKTRSQRNARDRAAQEQFNQAMEQGQAQMSMRIEWQYPTAPIRLLCAFQGLQMPPGFYKRHITHKLVREIIQEMTGIKIKRGRTPPRITEPDGPGKLEEYIDWALNEENSHDLDTDNLPEGVSVIYSALVEVDGKDVEVQALPG